MKNILILLMALSATAVFAQAEKQDFPKKYFRDIAKFNKANDSTKAEFYYKRGGIRQDYSDNIASVKDYDKALEMHYPDPVKVLYNKGMVVMDLDRYEDAIRLFTDAIALDPEKSYAYNNRGICKYHLNDYDGALSDYNIALKINPEDGLVYNNIGVIYAKTSRIEEGCKYLRKAYELGDKAAMKNIKKYCEAN